MIVQECDALCKTDGQLVKLGFQDAGGKRFRVQFPPDGLSHRENDAFAHTRVYRVDQLDDMLRARGEGIELLEEAQLLLAAKLLRDI